MLKISVMDDDKNVNPRPTWVKIRYEDENEVHEAIFVKIGISVQMGEQSTEATIPSDILIAMVCKAISYLA